MGAGHAHALYIHEHSRIHTLPPEVKVLATFLMIASIAITPREAIWSFVIYAVAIGALVAASKVPVRFILSRLVAIIPFVIFALLLPFIGTGQTTSVLGVDLSVDGLWATWNILAKAGLGATLSILLAATTEVPEILRGLSRLRVPVVLTSIASFMIRYLEVISGELGRMRTAMTSRGYDPRWLWQAKPIAASAGALFVRSYERGERVYEAMLSRGYTGTMPSLGQPSASGRDWLPAATLIMGFFLVAVLAMATT
jgi:cobalt/nickel transport system permease protein